MQKQDIHLIRLSAALGLAALCLGGCMSLPKQLPAEYFTPGRTLAVSITNKATKPEYYSSETAGVIAGSMYLTREASMRKCLARIDPQQITPLLRAKLPAALAPTFTVMDKTAPLVLEIVIEHWGWSLEAGKFGLRTHTYQFYISGTASIVDRDKNNRSVYFGYIRPTIDLGMEPTTALSEAAFPKAVEQYASDVARYIMLGKPK